MQQKLGVTEDEAALTATIIRLATRYGRYGYKRITALLRVEGWRVNHKRVERIWRREGLKVPQKHKKKGRLYLNDGSCIRLRPCWPNHVWAYDFVAERLGVHVSYSDFNSDTAINQVLKYTCRHLLKRSDSISTQQKLSEIVLLLSDVSDVHDIKSTLKKVIYTRSNERFRTLISFCSVILGGNNPTVSAGDRETFSLLFPMEQVFESFIGAAIRKNLSQWGFPHYRPYLQYKTSTSHLLHFVNDEGIHKPRIQVRPDIVIESENGRPLLVIDTKWKRLSESEDGTRNSASMADIYQVYSYAHHFNCDTNILLYPSMGSAIEQRYQLAASPDKALLINQIDFNVDLLTESKSFFESLKAIIEIGLLKEA